MKLTLTNFGVHTSEKFEFPDNGLTLISGQSGKGKTTILRAIHYALTGEGSKLPTFGEVKCKVVFEYNDLIVTRQNRPYKLIVDAPEGLFEGDEAQCVINSVIGKHFNVAGYIHQKGENSFLIMSPGDKLKFLENIAFADVPISDIIDKTKELVRNSEVELAKHTHYLQTLPENVQPPIQVPIPQDISPFVERLAVAKSVKKLYDEYIRISEKNEWVNAQILSIVDESLPEQCLCTFNPLDVKNGWKAWKEYSISQEAHRRWVENTNAITAELSDVSAQIVILTKETEGFDKAYEEYKEWTIQEKVKSLTAKFDINRMEFLEKEIPALQNEIILNAQGKDSRKCPGCKVHLRVLKDTLEIYSRGRYDPKIEAELGIKLKKMIEEFTALRDIKRELSTLPEYKIIPTPSKEYLEGCSKKRKELSDLKVKEKILLDRRKTLGDSPKVAIVKEPIVSLEEVYEYEKQLAMYNQEVNRVTKLNTANSIKLKSLQYTLQDVTPILPPENITDLEVLIENIKNDHVNYSSFLTKQKEWLCNNTQIQKATSNVKIAEGKYTLANKFKEKVMMAEMLALTELIEEINSHLSMYLDLFFVENPLTLELSLFKDSKKGVKSQVNIVVGYRGAITDLSSLSGGEKDRVNLAFTLALSEIFQIPLVMLDETLSSLDRETTENILEHIQKDERCVLVVAHQVSTGLFDHVFNI